MYRIGIDVGSTFTKYCVMNDANGIVELYTERTPVKQAEYFRKKLDALCRQYPSPCIVSCGYGKNNAQAVRCTNELTALAAGTEHIAAGCEAVLDIGGQDTKIIRQENGRLKHFFINDKCAAGSGMFLINVCDLLDTELNTVSLTGAAEPDIKLSSVCAVFAQTEIVHLLAENTPADKIIRAAIWQILMQSRLLLSKTDQRRIMLSGGLTRIEGFCEFAELALECECLTSPYSPYFSSIGCAVL